MNCHDFETAAGELAAGRLMDAAQRERAFAHTTSCSRCAARLSDERALTAGLRLVANTSVEEAPARIEATVLAAFRQNASVPEIGHLKTTRARWIYAAASAAAIALIAALIALFASRTSESQQPELQKAINPSPTVPDAPRQAAPPQQTSPASPESVAASKPKRSTDRARNLSRSRPQPNRANRATFDAEIATDYIPLMNRELFAQMDGGQVMRVELPRSALMSFGLPMDMERASERIKADVVVGNDGLARAIRFVR